MYIVIAKHKQSGACFLIKSYIKESVHSLPLYETKAEAVEVAKAFARLFSYKYKYLVKKVVIATTDGIYFEDCEGDIYDR